MSELEALRAERDRLLGVEKVGKALWALCMEYGLKHRADCTEKPCTCDLPSRLVAALKPGQATDKAHLGERSDG